MNKLIALVILLTPIAALAQSSSWWNNEQPYQQPQPYYPYHQPDSSGWTNKSQPQVREYGSNWYSFTPNSRQCGPSSMGSPGQAADRLRADGINAMISQGPGVVYVNFYDGGRNRRMPFFTSVEECQSYLQQRYDDYR